MLKTNRDLHLTLLCWSIALANILCPAASAEWPNDMREKRVHPVLKFSEPSKLNPDKLEAGVFKQMNGLYRDPHTIDFCRDDMSEGEEKILTSSRLDSLVKSHSQAEVESLIGPPELITGPIKAWTDCSPDQQNWFYYMGYCGIGVRVAFRQDLCLFAKVCNKELRREFENVAFAEIEKYSIGKTEAEIFQRWRKPLKPRKELQCAEDGKKKWIDSQYVREFWAGSDFLVSFHFTGDRCDQVERCLLFW
jgi:hypothetical protein